MLERTTISALLGPTNTGKTHRAVERMLDHESGMMGLPLRLLAREVYDRVTSRVGERQVALVTGEEKRVPPRARYWICTVEAMPLELEVDFLAVDEIQLAAHRQRGHVFTDRLLNARGRLETWFLGSDTMRPLVQRLLPTVEVRRHPRLSRLRTTGSAGLGQLPPRSAVVAFSMSRVYEIAERLRRRRGGAAVVLGALSPRARNAQVAMYQAGEVDHMVATDAIGMGLNLDLDHVALADLSKFDGRESRGLDPAEVAQIAGRAGRYHNDGTFGTLMPLPPLPLRVSRSIEQHEFAPERKLVWRSSTLDYSSVDSLIASLRQPPRLPALELLERADDFSALLALAERPEIRARAQAEAGVKLLWEACQIPDFRQLLPEAHARLVGEVFLRLTEPSGMLDSDWMAAQVRRLDDPSGDIDTLLMRMASIRTWTYVSSHGAWVEDRAHWQAVTRDIEDRLSDALHSRLVERFVDRKKTSRSAAADTGRGPRRQSVGLPSGPFARLQELRQAQSPAPSADEDDWLEELIEAPHERFRLDSTGRIYDGERLLGSLARGADLLRPEVRVEVDPSLGAGAAARLQRRLMAFGRDAVSELLGELRSERARGLSPAARGLGYQLEQGLGTVLTRSARVQLQSLSDQDRQTLAALGVRLGRDLVFLPALLKPWAVERRLALWNAHADPDRRLPAPPVGAVSVAIEPRAGPWLARAWLAAGFVVLGPRAVRADAAERAAARLAAGPLDPEGRALVGRWLGCPRGDVDGVLRALGETGRPPRRRRRRRRSERRDEPPPV